MNRRDVNELTFYVRADEMHLMPTVISTINRRITDGRWVITGIKCEQTPGKELLFFLNGHKS